MSAPKSPKEKKTKASAPKTVQPETVQPKAIQPSPPDRPHGAEKPAGTRHPSLLATRLLSVRRQGPDADPHPLSPMPANDPPSILTALSFTPCQAHDRLFAAQRARARALEAPYRIAQRVEPARPGQSDISQPTHVALSALRRDEEAQRSAAQSDRAVSKHLPPPPAIEASATWDIVNEIVWRLNPSQHYMGSRLSDDVLGDGNSWVALTQGHVRILRHRSPARRSLKESLRILDLLGMGAAMQQLGRPLEAREQVALAAAHQRSKLAVGAGMGDVALMLLEAGLLRECGVTDATTRFANNQIVIRDAVIGSENLTIADMAHALRNAWSTDSFRIAPFLPQRPTIYIHAAGVRSSRTAEQPLRVLPVARRRDISPWPRGSRVLVRPPFPDETRDVSRADRRHLWLEAVDFGSPEGVEAVIDLSRKRSESAMAHGQEILAAVRSRLGVGGARQTFETGAWPTRHAGPDHAAEIRQRQPWAVTPWPARS